MPVFGVHEVLDKRDFVSRESRREGFGQEVKVKLGHFFEYFLTINGLYNGATILNLLLAVVEI